MRSKQRNVSDSDSVLGTSCYPLVTVRPGSAKKTETARHSLSLDKLSGVSNTLMYFACPLLLSLNSCLFFRSHLIKTSAKLEILLRLDGDKAALCQGKN